MRLRPASFNDAKLLFEWRNDDATRENSRNADLVLWTDHVKWLKNSLARPDRKLLIAEIERVAVGKLQFDYAKDEAELSWAIAPEYRGRGHGIEMVCLAAALEPHVALIAEIKPANRASWRIAQRAGFHPTGTRNGLTIWRREPMILRR